MQSGRFQNRVYARGRACDTVRRLFGRIDDAAQRQVLEHLFPGEGQLEARLEQLFGEE